MKKRIIMLLICTLMSACACAEGLLPDLEEVYGVAMPSLYTLLDRYPDAVEETEAGLEETWENLSDADFTAFGEHLSDSGCEMLNYTTENSVFEAEVGRSGKTYRFIYDGTTKRAKLVFPSGTYDEALYAVEQDYRTARAAMEAEEYVEACALLSGIRGYRDVDEIMENDNNIKSAAWETPGSVVTLGYYEQDNDIDNGPEPIEWLILRSDGNTSMLISQCALERKPYSEESTSVTWESCSLRKWLNGEFLSEAFTEEEQAKLETVTVTADENPIYSIGPGNDTQDKVYLLSIHEADQYFSTDESRICYITKYADMQGAQTYNRDSACWWWLRTPGGSSGNAMSVYGVGSLN